MVEQISALWQVLLERHNRVSSVQASRRQQHGWMSVTQVDVVVFGTGGVYLSCYTVLLSATVNLCAHCCMQIRPSTQELENYILQGQAHFLKH